MNTNEDVRMPQKDSNNEEKTILGRFSKKQVFLLILSKLNSISDICGVFVKDEDKNIFPIYNDIRFPRTNQISFIKKDGEIPDILVTNDPNILVPLKYYEMALALNPNTFQSLLTFDIDPQVHSLQCVINEIFNNYAMSIFEKVKTIGEKTRNILLNDKLNISFSTNDFSNDNFYKNYNVSNKENAFIVDPIIKNIKIAINTLKHLDSAKFEDKYFIICDEITRTFLDYYLTDIPTSYTSNTLSFCGYFNIENIPVYVNSLLKPKNREGLIIVGKCADKIKYKGMLTYVEDLSVSTLEENFSSIKTLFKLLCATDCINVDQYDYLSFNIDYSNI